MADDQIHAFILPISVEKQLEAINMKKLIVSTFILLLTIGIGEISAQSFLERLGKAVGTEIEKGVKKGVEKAVGDMKEKAQEKKAQKQGSESVPASTNVSVGIAKDAQKPNQR